LTRQINAVFEVPVTVAEKTCEPKVRTLTGEPAPAITTLTLEPVWIVTVAESDFVASANDTAVTVTVGGTGTDVGAM
jgi:hypothetical protein